MQLFKKKLICALREHFRRYAHALRFAVGLHGTQKFNPIVKYKHYQISSGARASLNYNNESIVFLTNYHCGSLHVFGIVS